MIFRDSLTLKVRVTFTEIKVKNGSAHTPQPPKFGLYFPQISVKIPSIEKIENIKKITPL
jgi:hypothetical protein